jgi:hypothetical protein
MAKSVVVQEKFRKYCAICGKPITEEHHLIGGRNRHLCDLDGLVISLCNEHHTGSNCSAHHCKEFKRLCNMLAEVAWIKEQYKEMCKQAGIEIPEEVLIGQFISRYGENYL